MSHDRLYRPASCSLWPPDLLEVVGATYREAAGQGLDTVVCLDLTRAAYLEAGGEPNDADLTITSMIASLSRERGGWLWGPMEEWWAEHPAPAADEDGPFEAAP